MAGSATGIGGNTRGTSMVAGGAGFIGSHLCGKLLERGERVVCVDNLSTGAVENIAGYMDLPEFTFVQHDIALPIDRPVDRVYNLACPASPVHYQADPIQTIRTNVSGAASLLELARGHGATILQASTSEVYGDPDVHPQPESYWGHVNPIGPRACYDEGKRCAETLFFEYHRQHRVDIRVGRIFNTYGPRMALNDGRVVSNFIVQCLTGAPVTIYGDGSQTRSFCYVDDMVHALVALMDAPRGTTGPINLGNPEEHTVLHLAELVKEMTGSRSEIVFRDLPADDPRQRRPDITRAAEQLGWRPSTDVRTGLARSIRWFDEKLRNSALLGSGAVY